MDTWLHTAMEVTVLVNGLITIPYAVYRLCQIEKHMRMP
jgi:hypothetical protein